MLNAGAYVALGVFSYGAQTPLWLFFSITLVVFLANAWLYFRLKSSGDRLGTTTIIIWAVIFRLTGLLSLPIYEDDFYRYLWDGYLFSVTGSPYGIAPSEFFLADGLPVAWQHILGNINHPDIATIYGPTLQFSFLIGHWLSPTSVIGLQGLYALIDIALVMLLLQLTSSNRVMLYAWSPLVIKELAFTAHPDGLGVFLLMCAFFALHRRHAYSAALLLSGAVCAKVFAWLFVPFILYRCCWRARVLFVSGVIALYLPFLAQDGADLIGLFSFLRDWEFNSALYGLLGAFMPPSTAKISCLLVFLFLYALYFRHYTQQLPMIPRGDIIFGLFFLCAPVVNAWYLVWLLPFATLYPTLWAWTSSYAILLAYVVGLNLGNFDIGAYDQPNWVRPLEYGSILLAGLVDWHRKLHQYRK